MNCIVKDSLSMTQNISQNSRVYAVIQYFTKEKNTIKSRGRDGVNKKIRNF